jgi:hypothetical protein
MKYSQYEDTFMYQHNISYEDISTAPNPQMEKYPYYQYPTYATLHTSARSLYLTMLQ